VSVTRDDVRRIAALARIGVPDDRLNALVRELDGILAHMDVLRRIEPPTAPPEHAAMPLAQDEPGPVALSRAREEFAPHMRDGFFLVPRLDSHDGAGSS